MTTYSYKPATGLVGASTVVPLKAGGFLEVRRGEKTRWTFGEIRQTWATLDDWKATLPVGATVTEKNKMSPSTSWSPDFKMAVDIYKGIDGYLPAHSAISADKRYFCRNYNLRGYSQAMNVKRISDGEFIPLFFDMKQAVMHTPVLDDKWFFTVYKKGTTFAELGVTPVFLMRTRKDTPSLRLITC